MRAIRGRRLKSQQELVVFYGYVGLPEGYHQSSEISSKATILSTWGCMYFIVFIPPKITILWFIICHHVSYPN